MNDVLRLTVFCLGFIFALTNGYLLIKRKLTERFSILWLFIFVLIMLISIFPTVLNQVAYLLGVTYPPSLLYLMAILGMLSIMIYQSIQLTVLDQKVRTMSQTLAILENELTALRHQGWELRPETAATEEGVQLD